MVPTKWNSRTLRHPYWRTTAEERREDALDELRHELAVLATQREARKGRRILLAATS